MWVLIVMYIECFRWKLMTFRLYTILLKAENCQKKLLWFKKKKIWQSHLNIANLIYTFNKSSKIWIIFFLIIIVAAIPIYNFVSPGCILSQKKESQPTRRRQNTGRKAWENLWHNSPSYCKILFMNAKHCGNFVYWEIWYSTAGVSAFFFLTNILNCSFSS